MHRFSTIASIVVLTAVSASAATPAAPRLAPHTVHRLTLPAAATAGKKLDSKVSSRLRVAAPRFGAAPVGGLVPADPPRAADGKLQVYIDCWTLGPEQLAKLNDVGVTVDGVELPRARVRGAVDPAALDAVAAFSWVRAVRPIDPAVVRAGRATTEGDAAARADLVRAQGLDGTGVVVGIISDGIDHLQQAQQSGDLPAVTVPAGACRRGSGDEGTALLEIVHDIAPGATLLFAGVADSFGMTEAVDCLTAAGADVIVDDLGFFGEPYFEDGPVAATVRAAVQAGVSYHSSAGNEAEQHLEQDFAGSEPPDTLNPDVHDFGGGDNTDAVVVPPGGVLTCILEWNDAFGASGNDYDLLLLDQNLRPLASSNDPQTGTQDPIEIVSVVNQGTTNAVANVVIDRFAGEPRRLELFCLGAAALEHGTTTGSIIGHPALAEVVAVGAIDVADPGLDAVEPFSSRGPARIDFPTREDRAKPDLAAFDGVSISNAGGFPACPPFCAFFGTSAAAPHTAGVAALLLQLAPTLTPAAIQNALRAGAVDITGAGFDDASGFGRLDALAAVETLGGAPTPTRTPTPIPTTTAVGPDADGDGVADTIDPCTNVGHGQDFVAGERPRIIFARIDADAATGDDQVSIQGSFTLAAGNTFAGLDPLTRGARVIVQNGAGATRVDVRLGGGSFAGNGTRGWQQNRTHTAWTYRDMTRSPLNGITRLRIESRTQARRITVKVTGRNGVYPVVAGDQPLAAILVLGDQTDAVAGACGESAFVAADCAFNGRATTLSCKQ